MDPKLKERLQKDFWGNKGVDLSSLMGSSKQEPTLAEHRAMMEPWEKEDDKETSPDITFDMIEDSVSKMDSSDVLKLIHMITMKSCEDMNKTESKDITMPPMDIMPIIPTEPSAIPNPIA